MNERARQGLELLYKAVVVAFSIQDLETIESTLQDLLSAAIQEQDDIAIQVFTQAIKNAETLRLK
jgi:hypothetical protein